jgi:hypothetical protein
MITDPAIYEAHSTHSAINSQAAQTIQEGGYS